MYHCIVACSERYHIPHKKAAKAEQQQQTRLVTEDKENFLTPVRTL